MSEFKSIILALHASCGLLMIVVALPLAFERVGPNSWYGFRVPATKGDPAVWYKANAFAGRCLIRAGIAIIFACLALYLAPGLDGPTFALACIPIAPGAVLVSVILSFQFLGRITRDTRV